MPRLTPGFLPLSIFARNLYPSQSIIKLPASIRPATSSSIPNPSSASRRRAVTVANDTGQIPWRNLSVAEKIARTTQQSFNLGIVVLGVIATGGVATILYLEVFSADSKTAVFNRAADRVRKDATCQELLAGAGIHTKKEINAYGEPSWSRWARNRTIASRLETDKAGFEHLYMHFYVEGPVNKGTVNLHMMKRPGERDFEYRVLALDVPGHKRHYLENADANVDQRWQGKMFGVRWN